MATVLENEPKDVSCYSASLLINYARAQGYRDDDIFRGISDHKSSLHNPLEWVSMSLWVALAQNIEILSSEVSEQPLFEIARSITLDQVRSFQLFFLKVAPLSVLCRTLPKHFNSCTKAITARTELTPNGVNVSFTPVSSKYIHPTVCDYNRGCAYAIFLHKGYRGLTIKETACAARSGAECCVYECRWEPIPQLFEKLKTWFFFTFRSQPQILSHIQESHTRLQAQHQQLKSLQEFHSHIMSSMGEAVVWCDGEGRVEFVNAGFQRIASVSERESLGRTLSDLFPGLPAVNDLLSACKNHPSQPHIREVIFLRPGQDRVIGEATFTWVPAEERPAGLLVVIRDVTRSRELESKLHVAEDRYRTLYENSPAIVIGLDINGKIIYANPAVVKQTGFAEDELTSMTFKDLLAPESPDDLRDVFADRLSAPSQLSEMHFRTKSGDWKTVAMSTFPLHNGNGEVAGLAAIGVDVTETKRLNEQVVQTQRMELMGQIAGGLSHDFNNIMLGISGQAHVISMRNPDESTREQAKTILDATIRANDLIQKLLAFSKGRPATRSAAFNLNDVVKEAAELVKGTVGRGIGLSVETPEEQFTVFGDAGGIHQCILNLCMNARNALKDKGGNGGSIVLRLAASTNPGHVLLEVVDNGPGIMPNVKEKIFDPFFTTRRDKGGTGLGLSVVYGIVKAHQGVISVESRPGEGATFAIELPLAEAAAAAASKGVVLIVDDEATDRGLCMEVLKHYGYAYRDFGSSEAALDWLGDHPTESWLAVVDVQMVDMVPADFSRACKAVHSDFTFIWTTDSELTPELSAVVAQDILMPKPLTPYGMMMKVREAEKRRSARVGPL